MMGTTETIDHTELVECLGTCPKGYRYWRGADNHVYQQMPSEHWWNGHDVGNRFNGWMCSLWAWERHLHKLVQK